MDAKKAEYKKSGKGMYLSMFNLIAEAISPSAAQGVLKQKRLRDKLSFVVKHINHLHMEIDLQRREKRQKDTRIEDLTRQLEHVARDRQAAVDGFHESVAENNRNMEGAIKERERLVADCNLKLKAAQQEIFLLEVRRDELACHRMFLMAQLNWYEKNYGKAKATMRVDITQQNA